MIRLIFLYIVIPVHAELRRNIVHLHESACRAE